jgi:hypothetical protein
MRYEPIVAKTSSTWTRRPRTHKRRLDPWPRLWFSRCILSTGGIACSTLDNPSDPSPNKAIFPSIPNPKNCDCASMNSLEISSGDHCYENRPVLSSEVDSIRLRPLGPCADAAWRVTVFDLSVSQLPDELPTDLFCSWKEAVWDSDPERLLYRGRAESREGYRSEIYLDQGSLRIVTGLWARWFIDSSA